MERKLDFIEKEIQRLTLFLDTLLKGLSKIEKTEINDSIDYFEKQLKEEFVFSIYELESVSDVDFMLKLEKLQYDQLERLLVFLFKLNVLTKEKGVDIAGLVQKMLAIIKYLDKNSAMYSFERATIKNKLLQ